MDFLADVWVTCPVCEGQRFNRETLQVRFKGKIIPDVLEMDVQQALEHFENVPQDPAHAADAARRRPRLPEARPAVADALRRRGPADQAGPRAGASRAPARRSTSSTSRRPACTSPTSSMLLKVLHGFVEAGQHGARHRAQPRRDQDGRLDHRPRPGGRRRRRRRSSPPARRRRSPTCERVVHRAGAARRSCSPKRSATDERPQAERRSAEAGERRADHPPRRPRRPAAQPEERRPSTSRATR